MAILNFQKPDKVIMIDSSEFEGKFEFRPLEPGYGLTVGNALRRVLLSSLEGFAITSLKIDNIDHEFSTIPGIVEDVTEIILNLKQIRFKQQIDDIEIGDYIEEGETWMVVDSESEIGSSILTRLQRSLNISEQKPYIRSRIIEVFTSKNV